MAAITVSDLTDGENSLAGTGIFDHLMKAMEAHVEREYSKGRIKGGDYATVYLGALQSVMSHSLQFILSEQRSDLEAQLLQEQIQNTIAERAGIESQTALSDQQTANLVAEALNIPKQGALLDAQEKVQLQQKTNLQAQKLQTDAQASLVKQQEANAVIEGTVLTAQECKLRGEYDLIMEQKLKTVAETALLSQKKVTERAQTDGAAIGPDSVVDKQVALYEAQRNGYVRDSEQKAAKLLVDTWNVRKTMDDTTEATKDNKLSDEFIGEAVGRLLDGITSTAP
jgi:hypothetical protein